MTNYFARLRRSRGPWLEALVTDQSLSAPATRDELSDLVIFPANAPATALVVADQPAPARGYVSLSNTSDGYVVAFMHVLDGQPDEVYRALFSQGLVQARRLSGDDKPEVLVSVEYLAPHVAAKVTELGWAYAFVLAEEGDNVPGTEAPETEASAAEAIAQQLEETGSVQIEASAAAEGDLEEPEVREFFEDRGVEVEADGGMDEPAEAADDDAEEAEADESDGEPVETFECAECGKTFKNKQGLGAHGKAHRE